MQISFEQTSSFLLDLVSRFFTKILEKDTNNSYYLQQWNCFRQLICEKSLDIPQVLIFISQLSSPHIQTPKKDEGFKLLEPVICKARSREATPMRAVDIPPIPLSTEIGANILKTNKNIFNRNRSLTQITKYSLPSSPSSEIQKIQIPKAPRSRLVNINTPRKGHEGMENTERVMVSQEKGYPPIRGFSSRTYRALEPNQENIIKNELLKHKESGKKHDLQFLTKRAKKFNEFVTEHNEKLENMFTSAFPTKVIKEDGCEQRLTLKTMKIYEGGKGL